MNVILFFILSIALSPLPVLAIDLMEDLSKEATFSPIANDLVYGDGTSEINSSIDQYQTIEPNKPITGSIFVTHLAKDVIDNNSFQLGEKPLLVKFVETKKMSSTSNIELSIYTFNFDGFPVGTHTLPPINVKVAGQKIQALPLVIEVSEDQ